MADRDSLDGRAAERATIDALLDAARDGRGGGLMLRGEPGIGKSVLLDWASANAHGMRTLHAVGVQAETTLAYSVAHQLLSPVLSEGDDLPPPQRHALNVALGLESADGTGRFLVSVAALTLLSKIAEERPLLCVIDDAQWADTPSQQVLAFIARRLEAESVALLIAARDDDDLADATAMPKLTLARLESDAAVALLKTRFGPRLAPGVRDRLVEAAAGNPLALVELPRALTAGQRAGRDPLPEPLPLGTDLERMFLERTRGLDDHLQVLLLLAATAGAEQGASVVEAALRLGLDPGGLQSSQLADLVTVRGAQIAFRHPLVRSAVSFGASAAQRSAMHLALADVLDGDGLQAERRAWHRGQAAEGPDEQVAAELERSAQQALRRSGPMAAAAALERAAQLSGTEADRARRLVAAAEASWRDGHTQRARALLDHASVWDAAAPTVRLQADQVRGEIELQTGVPFQALTVLLPAARNAVEVDTVRAARLVILASEAAFNAADHEAPAAIGRIVALLPSLDDDELALVIALLRLWHPPFGADDESTAIERLGAAAGLADPELILVAGGLAWGLGHHALGHRLRAEAVSRARRLGAAGTLARALEYVVADEMSLGRYQSAQAYAEEGVRLAEETGRTNTACGHLALLAELAALRGSEADARRLAEEVLAQATARRLVKAAAGALRALGMLALAAGRSEEALDHYTALEGNGPVPGSDKLALVAAPDRVEAAVRSGAPDTARALLDAYLVWVKRTGSPELEALGARCRALLCAPPEADRRFSEALALHAGTDRPFDHARTELLYGEFLRRERRRLEARAHLRTAMETFERLGTPVWAERAGRELRATGETARTRDPSTLDHLTPQELQIARAVGEGSTNREVAAELFLSPRTIDYHLRKVFRKLEITSRAELMRLALDAGAPE